MAGFASQANIDLSGGELWLYAGSLSLFGIAIVLGMSEQFFSSKAYQEQQVMLEDFYGKYIDSFSEAPSNKMVRRSQVGAFGSFILALGCLGLFGFLEAKGNRDDEPKSSASAAPTTAATTSSTSAASAAASAAAPTTATADASKLRRRDEEQRQQVGGTNNASATSKEMNFSPTKK